LCVLANAQNPVIIKDPASCLYGLKDSTGKWILQPKYTFIGDFSYNDKAKVLLNNKNGIIDKKGKEIIPPIYDKIESVSGYLESKNQKENNDFYLFIINSSIVYQDGKCGMIDSTGKIILPIAYYSIGTFVNGISLVTTAAFKKCFADRSGITYCFPFDIQIDDYHYLVGINRFSVYKTEKDINGKQKKRWGVCDKTGQLILPFEFDSIPTNVYKMGIIGSYKNGKEGFYSNDGEKITENIYDVWSESWRWGNDNIYKYLLVSTAGKWGIIAEYGIFPIECKYDTIMEYHYDFDSVAFVCREKNNWTVLGLNGRAMLKNSYDRIAVSRERMYRGNDDNYLLAQKNGKWGAVNLSGFEMMKLEYDTVFMDDYYDIFWSPKEVRVLFQSVESGYVALRGYHPSPNERVYPINLSQDYWRENDYDMKNSTVGFENHYEGILATDTNYQYGKYLNCNYVLSEINISPKISIDSTFFVFNLPHDLFYFENEYQTSPYDPDLGYTYAVRKNKNNKPSISYAYPLLVTSSHAYLEIGRKAKMIIRDDGKIIFDSIPGKSIYGFGVLKDSVPLFYLNDAATNKTGLIDETGKIIVKANWASISPLNGDSLWVQNPDKPEGCIGSWNILAVSSGKLIFKTEDELFHPVPNSYEIYSINGTGKGLGVFDSEKMKFAIPPLYRYIFPLDRNQQYFSVVTFSGKTGIVSATDKLTADTTWQKIIEVRDRYDYGNRDSILSPFIYVLIGKNKQAVFDNKGIHPFDDAHRDSVLKFITNFSPTYYNYFGNKGEPRIAVDSGIIFQNWQVQLLTDSIFISPLAMDCRKEFRSNYSFYWNGLDFDEFSISEICKSWPSYPPEYYNYNYSDVSRECGLVNSDFLCFRTTISNPKNYLYNQELFYFNYLLIDNKPQIITLDYLFTGTEWKTLINKAIFDYLEQHPEVDAPCVNADSYPQLLQNAFILDSTGLILMPDWRIRNHDNHEKAEIQVLIPWEKVKPYLKKELVGKIIND
jgi:hypothetical protein